ncbi:MAG: hypothetical protein NW223_20490 [Hyphomicrobiaceae bacterium]|nr:hypothetical protein [Hyphomicrobiaceae bacterium]
MIGVQIPRRDGRWTSRAASLAVFAGLVLASPAVAAKIEWPTKGAYETCLQDGAAAWLDKKAELIVANDEAARNTNDRDVAAFVIDLMRSCGDKAKPASEASDAAFTKFMARWREHVYELTRVIRATGGSD